MTYKPRESDGLNVQQLVKELGDSPVAGGQSSFFQNIVKALWNLKRKQDSGSLPASLTAVIAEAQAIGHPLGGGIGMAKDGEFYYQKYNVQGASGPPTTGDNAADGYRIGSIWNYGGETWMLVNFSGVSATWVKIYESAF